MAKDAATRKYLTTTAEHFFKAIEYVDSNEDWELEETPQTHDGVANNAAGIAKIKILEEPVSTRVLPTSEQILLLKASLINGFKFPVWKGPPEDSDFELKEDGQLFQYVASRVSPVFRFTNVMRQRCA